MIVQEGRTYLEVNGSKVGPMKGGSFKWVDGKGQGGDAEWSNDGKVWCAGPEGYGDLIAEWTEGPVRTVTRTVTETTITPGTYARITVNDEGKAGMVGLWLNSGHYFSPSDLRAAAAVLLELAGALEE